VLFVCSGNICRSPTAEAVMRRLVDEAGLTGEIVVDGAGTGSWHVGDPPDPRATKAAARRDIRLTGTARQVDPSDFETFDLILAVDEENLERLQKLAPAGSGAQVGLLDGRDVPDPYYGGPDGFDLVLDQIVAACSRLLDELRQG
jgi:protein-tyrosine phosphatase